MGAAEARSAAKVLSMVTAALNGVGVEVPAHTVAQDASQHSALAGHPTPVHQAHQAHQAHQVYKLARIRPAVQQPATLAKAQLMATAALNMAIVEAQTIIAAQAAKLVLGLVANLRRGIHQVHLARHHLAR
jgi:hypothetical protein